MRTTSSFLDGCRTGHVKNLEEEKALSSHLAVVSGESLLGRSKPVKGTEDAKHTCDSEQQLRR